MSGISICSIARILTPHDRIPIHERVELPESWIPADSRVEIDAKITAGESIDEHCVISSFAFANFYANARLLHNRPQDDNRRIRGRTGKDMGRVSYLFRSSWKLQLNHSQYRPLSPPELRGFPIPIQVKESEIKKAQNT